MTPFKMPGATPTGNPLCESCRWLQKITGFAISQEVRKCGYGMSIRFPVHQCSYFLPVGSLSLPEMDGIAWILEKDKKSGAIGFKSAQELQREGRFQSTPDKPIGK